MKKLPLGIGLLFGMATSEHMVQLSTILKNHFLLSLLLFFAVTFSSFATLVYKFSNGCLLEKSQLFRHSGSNTPIIPELVSQYNDTTPSVTHTLNVQPTDSIPSAAPLQISQVQPTDSIPSAAPPQISQVQPTVVPDLPNKTTIDAVETTVGAIVALPIPRSQRRISPEGHYYLQICSWRSLEKAYDAQERLQKHGLDAYIREFISPENITFFRVCLGRYSDQEHAHKAAEEFSLPRQFNKPIVVH